jgi:hypothetical protein
MVAWQIKNNSVVLPIVVIDVAPADWQVRALGKKQLDQPSSLIWQNTNPSFSIPGLIAFWNIDPSGTPSPGGTGGAPPNFNWQISAFTDLDGNQTDDVLWINTATNEIAIWYRDGSGNVYSTVVVGIKPAGFRLATGVDTLGTGSGQLWFQNISTGAVYVWFLNTSGGIVSSELVGSPGPDWELSGVGRFTSNLPSLLFRNTFTNQVATWELARTLIVRSATIGVAPAGWKIIGVGNLD